MRKLIIVCGWILLLASCSEEKRAVPKKAKRSLAHLLTFGDAVKKVGKATGRHDTCLYLHRWVVELDGDKIDENMIVSEMLSDPQPLVSIYFKKKDTLVFIDLPIASGTTPEVQELFLDKSYSKAELGVRYTRREKDGNYTYSFSAYNFDDGIPYQRFSFPLYTITPDGNIINARTIEFKALDSNSVHIKLYEAEVKNDFVEVYMNNGPLLVKKSNEPIEEYISKWYPGNGVRKPYDHFHIIKGAGVYKISEPKPGENY